MRKRVFPGSSSPKVMNTPGPIDKDGTVSGKSETRVVGFDIFSGIVEDYPPFCDLKLCSETSARSSPQAMPTFITSASASAIAWSGDIRW